MACSETSKGAALVSTWRRVGLHLVCLLGIYLSLRLLFWWIHHLQFPVLSWSVAMEVFLQGLRFDLAALALINAPAYALYLLPLPQSWWRWQSRAALLLTLPANLFFLAMNIVDIEYYRFTGKRFTRDSFAITHDITQQLGQIVVYYWYYSLFVALLVLALIWLDRRLLLTGDRKPRSPWFALLWVLPLLGLAARGGWQSKPLIPAHAFAMEGGKYGIVTLNSSFTFLKSSDKASLSALELLPASEARALLGPEHAKPVAVLHRPRNVVLVILESFGREYVLEGKERASLTPFFRQLMQRGSSYSHAFANGRRSIDALPSILASIPAWMEPPFITSSYQTNRIIGLPAVLAEHGFRTHFYHGGNNGTMFFDVMARQLGFQRYLGASEYPDRADFDGQWGIFDEPFLRYVAEDLTAQQAEPFFATVFTLSSHHPYRIPDAYRGRFPKGTLEIHESLGYADYALQRFYETAKQQPWFADTLFILTADHTSKPADPLYETAYGRFAIPLVFIQNDQPVRLSDLEVPAQHADIMPTVLDLLDIHTTQRSPFGQSLLRPLSRPGVVLYEAGLYHLLGKDQLMSWNLNGDPQVFDWHRDPFLKMPLQTELDELPFLKASIQCYNNGMVYNQLVW